jgi:hypothetical protein
MVGRDAVPPLSPTEIRLVAAAVVLVLLVAAMVMWTGRRRSAGLKARFGPEYARTVDAVGNERKAEALLHARERRVASYTLKMLPPELRDHFIESWKKVQAQFVDDPRYAVTRADDLLGEVMSARGYPVKDFEQQASDLSVDHAEIVQNYRAAHDIAVRHGRGEAGTEEMRMAMIHYRALFDDLVHEPELHAMAARPVA